MLYKRQIHEIQMTDRSFITTSDYTPFQTSGMPAGNLARSGRWPRCSIRTNRSRVYNLNAAKNSVFGQGLVDRSADAEQVVLHRLRGVVLREAAGRRHAVRQLDRGEERLGVLRVGRQPERTDDRPTCIRDATSRRAAASAISATSTCRSCTSSSWRATTRCRTASTSAPCCRASAASSASSPGSRRRALFPNGQRTQAQTIILNEPGSLFGERWDQLDVNFKKNFRYGNKVHTFQLDIFNVFNNNSIRTMNDTVGTSLGQVTAIMPGRFPRLAYQFKW